MLSILLLLVSPVPRDNPIPTDADLQGSWSMEWGGGR